MFLKRIGPYRFYFFDHWDDEPPHVHVVGEKCHATFWLDHVVLIESHGLEPEELEAISALVEKHQTELLELYEGR